MVSALGVKVADKEEESKTKRRTWILLILGIWSLFILAAYLWISRTRSVVEIAKEIDGCFANLDGGCLYNNTWKKSLELTGWSKEKLDTLLKSEYAPLLKDAVPGELKLVPNEKQGMVSAYREYTMKSGKKTVFEFDVFVTDGQPKMRQLTIALAIFSARALKDLPESNPMRKLKELQYSYEFGQQKMQALGINGFETVDSDGNVKYRTWQDGLTRNIELQNRVASSG